MNAIYRGRRYAVVQADSDAVTLDSVKPAGSRIHVLLDDRDLLFKPDNVDLEMAEAFERGETEAFERPHYRHHQANWLSAHVRDRLGNDHWRRRNNWRQDPRPFAPDIHALRPGKR